MTEARLKSLICADDMDKFDNERIKKILPLLLFGISDVIGKGIVLISSHPEIQPIIVVGLNLESFNEENTFVVLGSLYYSGLFVNVKSIYKATLSQSKSKTNSKNTSRKPTLSPRKGSYTKNFMRRQKTSAEYIADNDIWTNRLVDLPHYQTVLMQLLCQCPLIVRVLMKCNEWTRVVDGEEQFVNKGQVLVRLMEFTLQQKHGTKIS